MIFQQMRSRIMGQPAMEIAMHNVLWDSLNSKKEIVKRPRNGSNRTVYAGRMLC